MTTRAPGRPTPTPFYVSEDDAPAKRRILVAALALFVRDGLCETSVRDIAKASGFTNPALFKHFRSKDDLARYLFERCYLELEAWSHRDRLARPRLPRSSARSSTRISPRSIATRTACSTCRMASATSGRRCRTASGAIRSSATCAGFSSRPRRRPRSRAGIDLELLTTAWIGTLQQFARFRYFGEFKQSTRALSDALDALLTRMARP